MTSVYLATVSLILINMMSSCDSTETDVVLAVRTYFRCNCVIFLVDKYSLAGDSLVQSEEILSRQGVPTRAMFIEDFHQQYSPQHGSCSHALIVIPAGMADFNKQLIQLSRQMRLTGPTWLTFPNSNNNNNNKTLDELFVDVHLPFDCQFLVARPSNTNTGISLAGPHHVTLTEVYRIANQLPLQSHVFGTWTVTSGLSGPTMSFYGRRNNLQGVVIRAVVNHDPPLAIVRKVGTKLRLVCGVLANIWSNLERNLNFTFDISVPTTGGVWGNQLSNGSWDGMIGMMLRGEADVGISGMVMNPERSLVVDYFLPLYKIIYYVYISELSGKDVSWDNFLSPFSPALWLAVLVATLATATFLALLYRVINGYHLYDEETPIGLADSVFYIFGAVFCQQSHDQSPQSLSCRIVYMIVYILGVIIVSSYSAFLTSSYTVIRPRIPFTTLRGLLDEGSYSLQTQKDAAVAKYFQNAKEGILRELFVKHVAPGISNAPTSSLDGYQRTCDEKFAYIGAGLSADIFKNFITCTMFAMPLPFVKTSGSFGIIVKNSPYLALFDDYFLHLVELGVPNFALKKLVAIRYPRYDATTAGITLEQVTPIMSIIAVGMVVAVFFMLVERMRYALQATLRYQLPLRATKRYRLALHSPEFIH